MTRDEVAIEYQGWAESSALAARIECSRKVRDRFALSTEHLARLQRVAARASRAVREVLGLTEEDYTC